MTKISYIAGVGATDRRAANGAGIKPQPFIPYLSMTKGEMELALLMEQAQILGGYYGDPKYLEAETMLQNALYRGLHGATPYLGAYNPDLRRLATVIADARRKTAPASKYVISARPNMLSGIHIGEPIIPVEDRLKACKDAAMKIPNVFKKAEELSRCSRRAAIERILNTGLEQCGQYLAYGFLPKSNNLPQTANTKILNHQFAQADIERVGGFSLALLQQWLNTGMMRKNVEVAKIDPLGWEGTNALLTFLPEPGQAELLALFNQFQKNRPGASLSESQAGAKMAAIVKKYQQPGVGIEPVTAAIAIIGAITALIGGISEFAKQVKKEQDDAFAQVNGFGSRFFGPEQGDYDVDGDGTPNEQDSTPKGSGDYTVPLLIGGAAALYFLTK